MIDIGPVRISGAIRGARLRVVWNEGTLYTVDSAGTVKTYDVPEEPTRRNSGYTYTLGDRKGSFYRSGCACNYSQKSVPLETILGSA